MDSRKTMFILAIIFGGCAPRPAQESRPIDSPPPSQQAPNDLEELTPTSPNVVYASKWSELVIHANFARTSIDVGAHFATSRNKCGREAFGAIDLQTWNTLAKNVNTASENEMSQVENCFPIPDAYPYMDGSVEVKIFQSQEKRTLFEAKEGQICTKISNAVMAKDLLDAIQSLIVSADTEDCAHGWGS